MIGPTGWGGVDLAPRQRRGLRPTGCTRWARSTTPTSRRRSRVQRCWRRRPGRKVSGCRCWRRWPRDAGGLLRCARAGRALARKAAVVVPRDDPDALAEALAASPMTPRSRRTWSRGAGACDGVQLVGGGRALWSLHAADPLLVRSAGPSAHLGPAAVRLVTAHGPPGHDRPSPGRTQGARRVRGDNNRVCGPSAAARRSPLRLVGGPAALATNGSRKKERWGGPSGPIRGCCWTPPRSRPSGAASAGMSTISCTPSTRRARRSRSSARAGTPKSSPVSRRPPGSSRRRRSWGTGRPAWPGSRPPCRGWSSAWTSTCCTRRTTPCRSPRRCRSSSPCTTRRSSRTAACTSASRAASSAHGPGPRCAAPRSAWCRAGRPPTSWCGTRTPAGIRWWSRTTAWTPTCSGCRRPAARAGQGGAGPG